MKGQLKQLELKSDRPLFIHIDGEVFAGFGTDVREITLEAIPAALERLGPDDRQTLQLLYTAAALLQQEHAEQLRSFETGEQLPDRFAAVLELPHAASPRDQLAVLGRRHRQRTRTVVNWVGTYENVVRRLLRSWELEIQWNR